MKIVQKSVANPVFITSFILLPITFFFGISYTQIEVFRRAFYITITLDILTIIYSVIKFKYFKNKRVYFIDQLENKTIEVKDIHNVNDLNPIEFEFFVKEMFVSKGYKAWTTKRTYDNGADIVAEKNSERIVIQVKHSSKSIKGYAVYQALRGKYNYKADKALLVTNNELTNQAKLDAIRDNVEVFNGSDISSFLRKNKSITLKYKR